ncbi:hypothetical protein G3N59_01150 [Paraburkholderia sp. Ac-20340]|uniref:hypothetical protein n=1 Tax=Paraburkholderia sp. Ac-20340 TaxID=2703888 RepID=UPI001980DEE8|nr:hypothetical protein [Paraburkholderia sp. Ac-20340]MBN3851974.1 hypothetical protein [Paraburkholderia sp. Ac-20340]
MNVEAGDIARVVNTGTANDGAVVNVVELDVQWTEIMKKPVWVVRGVKMLGFAGKIPKTVQEEGVMPDLNLRRVKTDRDAVDRRDLSLPMPPTQRSQIAEAVKQAMGTGCLTT